jgi:hypothetical protein
MPPSAASASAAAVRVSCQTIERATGRPVRRSQSTTDSRSLVIPIPAMSAGAALAEPSVSWMHSWVRFQTSSMSSSTQPGLG